MAGKGKGLPGKDWEKGCMKDGKVGGGWDGLGGGVSPLMEKGVGILGNSPCVRGRGKGRRGAGRPSLEKMSWLEPGAACLQVRW